MSFSSKSSSLIYKGEMPVEPVQGNKRDDNSLKIFISPTRAVYIDEFTNAKVDWTSQKFETIESCNMTPSFSERSMGIMQSEKSRSGIRVETQCFI
jgi:hypothetical protein